MQCRTLNQNIVALVVVRILLRALTNLGLRHVKPYYCTFTAYVKKRWLGKELLHVFTSEFAAFPPSYYTEAINSGRITVNGWF